MPLDAGDARAGTGLAGKLVEKMEELVDGFDVKHAAKGMDAMAQAIVEYIVDNAEINDTGNGPGGGDIT